MVEWKSFVEIANDPSMPLMEVTLGAITAMSLIFSSNEDATWNVSFEKRCLNSRFISDSFVNVFFAISTSVKALLIYGLLVMSVLLSCSLLYAGYNAVRVVVIELSGFSETFLKQFGRAYFASGYYQYYLWES